MGSADGPGADARFNFPRAIAIDKDGNRYVADSLNHTIRKISPAGIVTTLAGAAGERGATDGPGNAARFDEPQAIAVDPSGNVFVAGIDHTIRKITPAGVVSTFAGRAERSGREDGAGAVARFSGPMSLVADAVGNLYVADTGNHCIRKITPAGAVTTYAGLPGLGHTDGPAASALFYRPRGMTIDASGNLYVGSSLISGDNSRVIRKITPGGIVSTLPGSGVGGGVDIRGLAIDAAGNIFISASNYCIRRLTPAGQNTIIAGAAARRGSQDGPGASARFWTPGGLCIDSTGSLYLAGDESPVIRKIDASGAVTTIAGRPTAAGSADGRGTAARFSGPDGITGDSQGNIFVGDTENGTIRQISPSAEVTTFVGSPSTPGDNSAAPHSPTREAWVFPSLAIDSSDTLFSVAAPSTYFSAKIVAVSPAKVFTTIAASGPSGRPLDGPPGVAQVGPNVRCVAPDGAGNFFIGEEGSVRKIARDGTISTLAGSITADPAVVDGTGASARFFTTRGMVVDRAGNIFVSDTTTIRKITPGGVVSTLAGVPARAGTEDGQGAQARLSSPAGLTMDAGGNIFFADTENGAIRKVTPAGVVTTLTASTVFVGYFTEGVGRRARFMKPSGIWVSPQGDLYITDREANIVVKGAIDRVPTITTPPQSVNVVAGASATFAVTAAGGGLSYQWKFNGVAIAGATQATYTIAATTADSAGAYSVEISNSLGSITSPAATLAVTVSTMPAISSAPEAASVFIGNQAVFSVTASGGGLEYQWKFNGTPIPGATAATYTIASVATLNAGNYTVDIRNSVGTISSTPATLVVRTPGRLTNLSVLTGLASAGDSFTVGLTVGGRGTSGPKPLLLRAMGPSLASLGVPNAAPGTLLAAYSGAVKTDENRGWGGDATILAASARLGAFAFASATSADSAIYMSDAAGPGRTFTITGTGAGLALAEVYDATAFTAYSLATLRLVNLSVLKSLEGGLTAGFSIGGSTPLKVLIRGIGPALGGFGVTGAVARPRLEVFDASGGSLAVNAGWGGTTAITAATTLAGAFPLDPASADAVLLLELSPGNYTVTATAADGANGLALVEIYEVP